MKRISVIKANLIANTTPRRLIAVILGNLILGIGVAGLRASTMGNDPFCACAMAVSEGMHVGLGTYQAILNAVLFIVQVIWGSAYIGIGSLINMFLLGYVIQFAAVFLEKAFGTIAGASFCGSLTIMMVSLMVLSFGLSMYQKANLGISSYDYLSIGMTEHFRHPYFLNRVVTDSICVVVILVCVLSGFIGWANSHLGLATIVCAFCLGPFVGMFDKINGKWIW